MTQQHPQLKCRFRNPLITRAFACEFAHEITDRNGPGIICLNEVSHKHCSQLFDTLKAAALPILGMPDDLTMMPASVITKIQCGGLIALSDALEKQALEKHEPSENINALVESVFESYENLNDLNFGLIIQTIKDYKLRKRRQR